MISVIIPTKNRVKNLIKVFDSLNTNTYFYQDVEVVLYVDGDDEPTINFLKNDISNHNGKINVNAIIGKEKVKLADTYNKAFEKCSGEIIMYSADDVHFRTKNWDVLIKEEYDRYEDKIALVFGADGIQPIGTLATHGFLSRKAIEAIGYVHPIGMGYNYSDNWLTDIYRKLNRLVYTPVYFEHCHWGVGKAEYDETYKTGSDAPHDDSIDLWRSSEQARDEAVDTLTSLKTTGPVGNSNFDFLDAMQGKGCMNFMHAFGLKGDI